jgi:uncharacterized protein
MILPLIAVILYLLMNFYSYIRFIEYLNLNYNFLNLSIIIILALSMPLGMSLSKIINSRLSNFFYKVGTTWFGILIIILSFTILTDIINFFYFSDLNYKIALILIFFSILYGLINAKKIFIKKINIIGKENLNLVFISDLHVGEICNKKMIKTIVNKINKLKPEVVLISGDFFDGSKMIKNDDLKPLSKIKVPIFMVLGNHDFYYGEKKVHEQLSKYMTILRNEKGKIKNTEIIGFDDQKINLVKHMKIEKDAILLHHRPTGIKSFIESNAQLMLSGHTHNGQLFPIFINLIFKYPYGLYKIKNKYLYTSSGVVGWGPRIRFGSINEIVNIKIIKR